MKPPRPEGGQRGGGGLPPTRFTASRVVHSPWAVPWRRSEGEHRSAWEGRVGQMDKDQGQTSAAAAAARQFFPPRPHMPEPEPRQHAKCREGRHAEKGAVQDRGFLLGSRQPL